MVKLTELRKKAGMTQIDLAVKSHVSYSTITKIERGVLVPSLRVILKLAAAMAEALGQSREAVIVELLSSYEFEQI